VKNESRARKICDIDVPEGNKLQWLLGFIDPLKHKEAIESWKNDNKLS
jgi:hypothetical protein